MALGTEDRLNAYLDWLSKLTPQCRTPAKLEMVSHPSIPHRLKIR